MLDALATPYIRETLNALWFAVDICVMAVFAAYLFRAIRRPGWRWEIENQAALALLIYFAGETLIRGWVWLGLWAARTSWNGAVMNLRGLVVAVAATISAVGALGCVWVFSRSRWSWLAALAFVVLFTLLMGSRGWGR